MALNPKQFFFSKCFAKLILYLYDCGYEVQVGDVRRSLRQAAENAAVGSGIKNSLHALMIAGDLTLFKDGNPLAYTVGSYKVAGEYWESLSTEQFKCAWGGRFVKPDADHFSIENDGVR